MPSTRILACEIYENLICTHSPKELKSSEAVQSQQASIRVILPWSTCAIIAILRISILNWVNINKKRLNKSESDKTPASQASLIKTYTT